MRDPSLKLPDPPAGLADLSQRLCTTIVNEIGASGAIPFARFMEMALYQPGLGYYVNGLHKFGAAGDFVTAPEEGELFARAVARALDRVVGCLTDWTLLEAGPGSGRLARDVLMALGHPPARCLLLEPSAPLREIQAETLAELPGDLAGRVEWIDAPPDDSFDGVIVANEVADALPVHRFRIGVEGIEQACVTVEHGRFAWRWSPAGDDVRAAVARVLEELPEPLETGYVSEVCTMLPAWLQAVTAPLARGVALFVDYGYPRREYYHPARRAGTLVCHYRHRAHFDPFVWPGLTDISAFVDFTALCGAGRSAGLELLGFTNQAAFVLESGVANALEAVDDDARRMALAGEFKRLVMPGEMGERFKVLGMARDFDGTLPGAGLSDQTGRL